MSTAQFAYACRKGCDLGFLTSVRRDAHERSAHPALVDLSSPAPDAPHQSDPVARIDAVVGPDDPEEGLSMDEVKIACSQPGCDRTFRNQHGLDVHVARSHKKTVVGGGASA